MAQFSGGCNIPQFHADQNQPSRGSKSQVHRSLACDRHRSTWNCAIYFSSFLRGSLRKTAPSSGGSPARQADFESASFPGSGVEPASRRSTWTCGRSGSAFHMELCHLFFFDLWEGQCLHKAAPSSGGSPARQADVGVGQVCQAAELSQQVAGPELWEGEVQPGRLILSPSKSGVWFSNPPMEKKMNYTQTQPTL